MLLSTLHMKPASYKSGKATTTLKVCASFKTTYIPTQTTSVWGKALQLDNLLKQHVFMVEEFRCWTGLPAVGTFHQWAHKTKHTIKTQDICATETLSFHMFMDECQKKTGCYTVVNVALSKRFGDMLLSINSKVRGFFVFVLFFNINFKNVFPQ